MPRPPAPQANAPATGWRLWPVLITDTVKAWFEDRCASMGAALAYYTLFSIAPLLLIVVSVAGLLYGAEAARGEIASQLEHLIGSAGAQVLQGLLASVRWPGGGVAGTLGGALLMLLGATTVVNELQASLDRIWRSPEPPGDSSLLALLRARLHSLGLILGLGFLLVVSLLADAALAAAQAWWAPWLGGWLPLAWALNMGLGFALLTLLFALIFKLMPRARIAWSDVWLGAVVTALLFELGRGLIGFYIGHGAVLSGFGAAASLVAVLTWVYYSAQIFLLGAEFTWVVAHRLGSLRPPTN